MLMTFDPTTTEFSQANAYACALQSAEAYDESPTIFTDLAHVRISETAQALFVAFRGSKSIRDWITDGEFLRQSSAYFGGSIHGGFLRAWLDIENQLIDRLFKIMGAGKPLLICGHSLGGAMAQLCSVACQKLNLPVRAVYTFGQPRVGDAQWARGYGATMGSRTFRLVYEEDIVPRIPWLGYKHCGQFALLPSWPSRLSRETCPLVLNPPLWKTVWSDLIGLYRAFRARHSAILMLEELLEDHHIDKYIARLSS